MDRRGVVILQDWIQLINEAKNLGLTVEEVRAFLQEAATIK